MKVLEGLGQPPVGNIAVWLGITVLAVGIFVATLSLKRREES